jgi:gamma-glutamyltranspeptidase/glutathione hydrolase
VAWSNRQQLTGTFGMVTSTHWLASAAGMAVLEEGGNAFDAAVAAGFVLQVVEPHLNGLGGEVPIIACAADQEPFVICGQGTAPERATIEYFADLGLDLVPGTGLLPACVPGAFAAWLELLDRWGTRSLPDVLRFAIGYAEYGYPLVWRAARTIATVRDHFLAHWPTSAAVYLDHGEAPAAGRFRNPDLARTYQRLAAAAAGKDREGGIDAARRTFYEGFVAEAMAEYCTGTAVMDTSGEPHAGLLSYEDMAGFSARVEKPLAFDYAGYTICKTGPWGQGPVFLQQLALLAGFDLDDTDPAGDELVHAVTECAKLAFADREAYYGDPDFADVPLSDLLSPAYNDERRRLVGDDASLELRPGSPGGAVPVLPHILGELGVVPAAGGAPVRSGLGAGEPTVAANGEVAGDTCHVDVIDRWGNLVSATPSGGWLQSSPVVPGLGFGPTTRGQMFWLQPGLPNSLTGGKRPRTTLSPGLMLRGGVPCMAFGTPGGDSQDQWSMTFFLRHVHHGLDVQEAIEAPSWHTRHFPSSFYPRRAEPGRVLVEERFGDEVIAGLLKRGHDVEVQPAWSLGRMTAAGRGPDGMLCAGATQRTQQGYAVGR